MNDKNKNGIREGIARCCSQACIFGLEARKTLIQVHGYVPRLPMDVLIQRWTTGILTSSITSGIVFGTYFTVYNRMDNHVCAGAIASLVTSIIKIPISNGMRMMQSGKAHTLFHAGAKIVKRNSWKGLYSGYFLSLIEDIIEFDLRARLYRNMQNEKQPIAGFLHGGIAGALAAGVTTPFDTIRCQLVVRSNSIHAREWKNTIHIAKYLVATHGIQGLYRGLGMRMLSNAVKSALFFTIYEMLPSI
jgi:hypothetical protein